MRELGVEDIRAIARGAAILGSGGGGDPHIGALMTEQAIRKNGPVPMVGIDEVPDDALVVLVGGLGAPTIGVERPSAGTEAPLALKVISELLGEPVTHLGSIEAGGINSTIPIMAAAQVGLPLVDMDGMGRAFPEVPMMIPSLMGIRNAQMVMADANGNVVIIRAIDDHWYERFARATAIMMGCGAMTAQFAMRGHELAATMVGGTISLCLRLGIEVESARLAHRNPLEAAAKVLGGHLAFAGKITDVERATKDGFARGLTTIAGTDDHAGSDLTLEFQNEHLIARIGERVLATVPDLICVLDIDSGEPITTENLRFGQRVGVLLAPCDPRWRTEAGLKIVGPRYFGYDYDYVPV
ncbi:MAG TPA: DUF917 domain-containing protein [Streptosporangiaceae bacterium]|jgi:hypothetical protein